MKPRVNLAAINCLNPYGSYVTGSAIIGNFDIESDIDIVIPIDVCVANDNWLREYARSINASVELSSYNNGLKLIMPGYHTINILRLHPLDYCAFMFATDTLRRAPIITNRNARHRAFEELCHTFKSFIGPDCVTIAALHKCAYDNRDAPFMQRNINWETFEARSV